MIVGERAGIFENVSLKTNSPQVIFTGRIDNQKLVNLYRAAHAFVSPSVYEGFGLPPPRGDGMWLPLRHIRYSGSSRGVRDRSNCTFPPTRSEIGLTRCAKPRAGARENANVENN